MQTDTLKRDDINPSKINAKVKRRKATVYCAMVNGWYGSRFHSKNRANRAVRLLKAWGKDAYLSSPMTVIR